MINFDKTETDLFEQFSLGNGIQILKKMINITPKTQTDTFIILLKNYKIIIENYTYDDVIMNDFWIIITNLSNKCEKNSDIIMYILDVVKKIISKIF